MSGAEHVEVIVAGPTLVWGLAAAGLGGSALVWWGAWLGGGLLGWTLLVAGSVVLLVSGGSAAFSVWGRYAGFGWHFTP